MAVQRLALDGTLASLHPEWPEDPLPDIRNHVREQREKIIVVDDDPMGVQASFNVTVLMDWSLDTLVDDFRFNTRPTFIVANTRGMSTTAAKRTVGEIAHNVTNAARMIDHPLVIIGRGDSTLRGHYFEEAKSLAAGINLKNAPLVLSPFFFEGGRVTIDDIHYVIENNQLIPAGQSEFAKDATFGYSKSRLHEWVGEKTLGVIKPDEVCSISLDTIRKGGPSAVTEALCSLQPNSICITNAVTMRDIQVVALGSIRAEERGRHAVWKTAASFINARAGIGSAELIQPATLNLPQDRGGLIVVGSHTSRTNRQLKGLSNVRELSRVEIDVDKLLSNDQELLNVIRSINRNLRAGVDTAIFTSRRLIASDSKENNLLLSAQISEKLALMLQKVCRPKYVIAKGGMTSYDIATKSLHARRALALGQILPGIPIWQLDTESSAPGMTFIPFPGNQGTDTALSDLLTILK